MIGVLSIAAAETKAGGALVSTTQNIIKTSRKIIQICNPVSTRNYWHKFWVLFGIKTTFLPSVLLRPPVRVFPSGQEDVRWELIVDTRLKDGFLETSKLRTM